MPAPAAFATSSNTANLNSEGSQVFALRQRELCSLHFPRVMFLLREAYLLLLGGPKFAKHAEHVPPL